MSQAPDPDWGSVTITYPSFPRNVDTLHLRCSKFRLERTHEKNAFVAWVHGHIEIFERNCIKYIIHGEDNSNLVNNEWWNDNEWVRIREWWVR